MKFAIYWYSYQYFLRKIFEKRYKNNNDRTSSLSLLLILLNSIFIISLCTYLFNIKFISNLFKIGLPLGPIAAGIGFLLLMIYYINFQPKYNGEIISMMRIANLKTKEIKREWAQLYLGISIILFLFSIHLIFLATKLP